MSIILIIVLLLVLSVLLAALSLRDYQGQSEYRRLSAKLNKEKIKGGIVFEKGRVKHYSSNSGN